MTIWNNLKASAIPVTTRGGAGRTKTPVRLAADALAAELQKQEEQLPFYNGAGDGGMRLFIDTSNGEPLLEVTTDHYAFFTGRVVSSGERLHAALPSTGKDEGAKVSPLMGLTSVMRQSLAASSGLTFSAVTRGDTSYVVRNSPTRVVKLQRASGIRALARAEGTPLAQYKKTFNSLPVDEQDVALAAV